MSSLTTTDKQVLEKLLGMQSGWVLNFVDRSFTEFFKDDLGINIRDLKFDYGSNSKANRMRAFWTKSDDRLTSKCIVKLLAYIDTQILVGNLKKEDFPDDLRDRARAIANRLRGGTPIAEVPTEDEFIQREFRNLDLDQLALDSAVTAVLKQRIEEIKRCISANAPLAAVFLCGSSLEGILLGVATKRPKQFNQSSVSPRKDGKVKQFHDWNLSELINVARDCRLIGEDVKKFSHALRDFRNYIHPFEQMSSDFRPDAGTARICWQVLQAAIYQLSTPQL